MATRYISTTGNDSTGDGLTVGTAWASISKAYASCSSGDTIVMVGHSTNTFAFYSSNGWAKNLTITAHPDYPRPVIDAGGNDVYLRVGVGVTLSFSDVTFENLRNTSAGYGGTLFMCADAVAVPWSYLNFTRCVFKTWQVDNSSGYGGFYARGQNKVTLVACCIYGVSATGATKVLFNMPYDGLVDVQSSTIAVGSAGLICIFMFQQQSLDRLTLKNSIVASDGTCASLFASASPPTWLNTWNGSANNCLHNLAGWTNTDNGSYSTDLANMPAVGLVAADPLFVDAPNGNFNLRDAPGVAVSPCKSAGVMP